LDPITDLPSPVQRHAGPAAGAAGRGQLRPFGFTRWNSLDPRWKFGIILALIAMVAAIPRLVLGRTQYIEYDGYWHVFIALQDNWRSFWREIKANAHPPLYFLLLKVVLYFGRSLLVYRAISLVTGIASVFVVGRIARRLTRSSAWSYQTAIAYGLALPGITISCEVRSYMLSTFFVLLSFSSLLDLIGSVDVTRSRRLRAGFALWAILACLSHYFAFFYAGAAIFVLLAHFAVRKFNGERTNWKAETATILPVIAVVAVLYRVHVHLHAEIQNHLLPFYFDPMGKESVPSFLIRNWKNFLDLFLPFRIQSDGVAIGALVMGFAGAAFLVIRFSRNASVATVRASSTILITAVMLGAIALAAVAGKYPFGGDLRQQFLLFPFLALCLGVFAANLNALVRGYGRWLLHGALALLIVGISVVRFQEFPKISANVLGDRIELFNRLEPSPKAVYLDQFNLITFFIYHHDWQWSFLKQQHRIPGIDIYQLRKGPRQMLVFRDITQWNAQPDDAAIYYKLAECLRAGRISDISIFCVRQSPPEPPLSDVKLTQSEIVSLAAGFSVCVQRLLVNPVGWYGTFRNSGCTASDLTPRPMSGEFDDANDAIEYSGMWNHGSFSPAANGTVSYSNDPTASARLLFKGQEITYVYSKAFNRGIAAIKIDGADRGVIDLYSPKIGWQSRAVFNGLAPGNHIFEVAATGRKDDAATDRVVDIDALIVR
jgi:hypothetical protein